MSRIFNKLYTKSFDDLVKRFYFIRSNNDSRNIFVNAGEQNCFFYISNNAFKTRSDELKTLASLKISISHSFWGIQIA